MDQQPQIQPREFYTPVVTPEPASTHPGRVEGIISIICAVISLGLFPPVFGITGIVLGLRSYKKGAKSLGLVGVILSAVFMVIGFIVGAALYVLKDRFIQGAAGIIWTF